METKGIIKVIKLQSYSGYCYITDSYSDDLSIECDRIAYVKNRGGKVVETWNHTDVPENFNNLFLQLESEILKCKDIEPIICYDAGGFVIELEYEEGKLTFNFSLNFERNNLKKLKTAFLKLIPKGKVVAALNGWN